MRKLLCGILAISLAACGASDSTSPPPLSVLGTWNLSRVNGDTLPYQLSNVTGYVQFWDNEQLALNSDGSEEQTGELKTVSTTGVVTVQDYLNAGSFSVSGSSIKFTFGGGASGGTGSYAGDTLHMTANGYALTYVKP